jgi:hypothetical protein
MFLKEKKKQTFVGFGIRQISPVGERAGVILGGEKV